MTRGRLPWAAWGLVIYGVLVVLVLVLPIGYGGLIEAATAQISAVLGTESVNPHWVEFGANILIFAPLGFLLTLLFDHPWRGALLAAALSIAAELGQILIPARTPSARDVLANALGAAVGAALAWFVVRRRRRLAGPRGKRS
ncbi:VanZ family protein [Microbacterium sp. KHB019]|uniref:VanZ family protein n=1 Tax=Microbacterium sp. KHB019 TaxID=3129770 RepID=UPI00307A42D8